MSTHKMIGLYLAINLLLLSVGFYSRAEEVKPIDPSKVESKLDQQDLRFFKGQKKKITKKQVRLQNKQKKISNKITLKNNRQVNAQAKIAHLKERLSVVSNDPHASKALQARLSQIEKRMAQRATRLEKLNDQKSRLDSKQQIVSAQLNTVDSAISTKQEELVDNSGTQ